MTIPDSDKAFNSSKSAVVKRGVFRLRWEFWTVAYLFVVVTTSSAQSKEIIPVVPAQQIAVRATAGISGRKEALGLVLMPLGAIEVFGRYQGLGTGVVRLLVFEGSVAGVVPFGLASSLWEIAAMGRVGIRLSYFLATIGVQARFSPLTRAIVQYLPSLHLAVGSDAFMVELMVADQAVGPIASVGIRYKGLQIAYVPAVGLEIGFRWSLGRKKAFEACAFGQGLFTSRSAGVSLSFMQTGQLRLENGRKQ